MLVSIEQITAWLGMFIWPFFRIAAMMTAISVFGTRLVPQHVRLILSVVITISVFYHLPEMPKLDALSLSVVLLIIQQIIIGLAFGFIIQLVFQAFVIAGQLIAMQAGLGFASMIDPQNGVSVPVVSQLYLMLVTLLYLAMNGHLVMIDMIVSSFYYIPINMNGIILDNIWILIEFISWIFIQAVVVSLPAVSSLMVVNIGFGVMTRAAPQLNIFTVGFPITLGLGLFIIYFTISGVPEQFDFLLNYSFNVIKSLMGQEV